MEHVDVIMTIIAHAGNARTKAMEAIQKAEVNRLQEARLLLQDAGEEVKLAHRSQTELIQKEARGERVEVSLFMVHAQDHLMNAMTVIDMAEKFINLYEKIDVHNK
ncbi:MAG: PTS lactose/cellobiose transporter subunit IIA [Caldibacillus sp.]